MALVCDRCICLRKFEYSETSQILTLLASEHGLLRAIAKGAHRRTKAGKSKFDGGVDLLDLGSAVFSYDPARELATLTEWSLLEGHLPLRRHLRSLYLALYASELIAMLFEEHDAHPGLFARFEATLRGLGTPQLEEVFLTFQLDLLREAGFLADLFTCVSCSAALAQRDPAFFSPSQGGVICANCQSATPDRISIDPRLLRVAQNVILLSRTDPSLSRLPHLTRHQTDPLNRIFAAQVEHTLSRRLRLRPYVL